jgi:hypothetical protein
MVMCMENVVEMESVEELLRFLEAEVSSLKEAGESCIGRPVVFIGEMNERDEKGIVRISVLVTSSDDELLLRYVEPVGSAELPLVHLKDVKETELVYERQKKDFDVLTSRVDARRKELEGLFDKMGYPVFLGVLT